MTRPFFVRLAALGLTATTLAVGGCGSTREISGKVIAGEIGIALAVASTDPRLEGDGLADARVIITDGPGRDAKWLAEAMSRADGGFSAHVPGGTGRLGLRVERDGYLRLQTQAVAPNQDESLLIQLEGARGSR